MKFLCPNCKAKYRIGPEKMVGRQAAKIRCRKCEFLIQIAFRSDSDDFDVTATPPSVAPPPPAAPPAPRLPKGTAGQPVIAPVPPPPAAPRPRALAPLASALKDEGSASKRPTAAVPGLPGLGSAKSTRGAAMLSDAGLPRRPLAPLPPPPVPPFGGSSAALASPAAAPVAVPAPSFATASGMVAAPSAAPGSPAPAAPSRSSATNTQLGDQFRESVQAGGASEELPQEGWFVGVNGVPLGPIPLGDLRELAMAGHIDRRSLVWRDGHPEWRPLGKFPGLVRLIDDGGAPPATPPAEPVASSPAAAAPRPNGASNGQHVATGFDVVRAEVGGPSAWGDLDDEDDEDEQPTTVKGRVSVLPSAGSPPVPVPLAAPAPMAPIGGAQGAANPFGVISAPLAIPSAAPPTSMPPTGMPPTSMPPPSLAFAAPAPSSPFGIVPEPALEPDVGMIRSPMRNRWYLIIAAIVFAFALGAIVTHLMRTPSTAEKPGKRAGNSQPSAPVAEPKRAEPLTQTVVEDLRPITGERAGASAPSAQITTAVAPSSAVASAPGPRTKSGLANEFLARLGTPVPSAQKVDQRQAGAGLDATAIQRTVRRHSPGVRQNCWLRARESRAPGVPSSAKLSATITVEPSGRVDAVAVSGAPKGYPGLARCIEANVKGWQFPRSNAPTITNIPFMFVGQ